MSPKALLRSQKPPAIWYDVAKNMTESDTQDENGIKKMFEGAIQHLHPEEAPQEDPFETDGLGHPPAEEDDSGGD